MPRNTRLSAYYTTSPSPSHTATTTLPKTREAALSAAQHQTLTEPLSTLLTTLTKHTSTSKTLSSALLTATTAHYKHLRTAYEVTQSLQTHLTTLDKQLAPVPQAITHTRELSTRLKPVRDEITALESVHAVQNLLTAMDLLSQQMPALAGQLALCTDPQQVSRDVVLASRRFACVRPALGRMAAVDTGLRERVEKMDTAAMGLSDSLQGEQSVLSRGEVAEVRILLGERKEDVERGFVADVVRDVMHAAVGSALAGEGLDRCRTRLELFERDTLPKLQADVEVYERLFGDCTWAEQVALEALADAREEVERVFGKREKVSAVRGVLERLRQMPVARAGVESVEKVLRESAVQEGVSKVSELLEGVDGLQKDDVVARVNEIRDGLEAALTRFDAEHAITRALASPIQARLSCAAAAACETLSTTNWDLAKVRDIGVERCLEAVLQEFRDALDGDQAFVKDVRWVCDVGSMFGVQGLVDDDLGDGFGHRVTGGVVQIVRERVLDAEEGEGVLEVVRGVGALLDVRRIEAAVRDRLIE